MSNLPSPNDHGWYHGCNIERVQEQFLDNVSFLLLHEEDNEMVFDDSDDDCDDDDEQNEV